MSALQAVAASALDLTATIQRDSGLGTPDSYGTQPDNWQNVAGLVNIAAGRATPSGQYQMNLAAALGTQQAWTVSLPTLDTNGAPVVVHIGDRCLIDGLTLTVQALLEQSYSTLTQFLASAVRPG